MISDTFKAHLEKIAVKDGIGRYVNPLGDIYSDIWPGQMKAYRDFEVHADQTQFSTNAADGDYTDVDFEKEVWEWKPINAKTWSKIEQSKCDKFNTIEDLAIFCKTYGTISRSYREWLGDKVKEETVEGKSLSEVLNGYATYQENNAHQSGAIIGARWQADRLNTVISEKDKRIADLEGMLTDAVKLLNK